MKAGVESSDGGVGDGDAGGAADSRGAIVRAERNDKGEPGETCYDEYCGEWEWVASL